MIKYGINCFLIKDFIAINGISKKEFAQKCGMSVYMLNRILGGYLDFDITYLLDMAKVMNIKIVELIIRTKF